MQNSEKEITFNKVVVQSSRRGSEILKRFFEAEDKANGKILENTENLDPVDLAELSFLERFKNEIQNSDLPFLENTPRDAYLAEQIAHLANKGVVPIVDPNPLLNVIGPKVCAFYFLRR